MSLPDRLRTMAAGRIARFGAGLEVTIRTRATLKNKATGASITALTASGAHLAGAATINLTASGLEGSLPAGAQITIAATTYTVGAQIAAASGILTGVAITPVLAGNVANGAAVTVSQPYADHTFPAMRSRVTGRDAMQGVPDEARVYRLSAVGTYTPKKGDQLIDGDTTDTVLALGRPSPGGAAIFHTLYVGRAA